MNSAATNSNMVKTDSNEDQPTILDVVKDHVQNTPDHEVFNWYDAKGSRTDHYTYATIWEKSGRVAKALMDHPDIQQGDRVMICFPFGLDFLPALIGCMRAGVIACSAYPPNPMKLKTDLPVFLRKAKNAGAKYVLTTVTFQRILRIKTAMMPSSTTKEHNVQFITTETCFKKDTLTVEEELLHSISDIAFIQYTSGSTSFPKGVMITHKSLIENTFFIRDGANRNHPQEPTFGKVIVSWVPQYHDFGLMINFMTTLVVGWKSVSFSPIDFITNPLLWHRMIIDHQASFTPGPNFAYGLVAKRLLQARSKTVPPKFIADVLHKSWDRLESTCFGGEPTDPKVIESTVNVLGVRPECILNGYGMAETGVGLCNGSVLVQDGVVDCGNTQTHHSTIQIVDNDGNAVPDGTVGEIWAQTKMVAAGYWKQPELTQQTFKNTLPGHDGYWLATGDLGKVVDGRLYVTGRKKEMIIINGRNFFPVDLERTLETEFPAIRPGCNVVFQYTNSSVGITAELRKGTGKKGSDSIPNPETIRRKISETHKVPIWYVCLLQDHTVPKTTSGKLRRIQTRETSQQHGWKAKSILAVLKIDKDDVGDVTEEIVDKKGAVATVVTPTNTVDGDSTAVHRDGLPFEPTTDNELSRDPVRILQRSFRASAGKHVDPDQPIEELGLASLEIAAIHSRILEDFDMDADDFPITSLFDGDTTLSQIAQDLRCEEKSLSTPHDASLTETWDETGDEYDENDNDAAKDVPITPDTTQSFLGSVGSVLLQTFAVLIVPLLVAIASYPTVATTTYTTTVELSSSSSATALLILVVCLPLLAILNTVFFTTILIVTKWLLVGKQQEICDGRPVWGVAFAGRWIVRQYARFCWTFTQWAWLNDTELLCVLHRYLGCTIGTDVKLTAGMIEDFDLVTIGNGSSVSGLLNTETIEHGKQLLGSIDIGSDCTVASHTQIDQCSRLADNVMIKEQTMVPRGSVLEAHTVWQGHHAKRVATDSNNVVNQMAEEPDLESQESIDKTTTQHPVSSMARTASQRSFTAFRLLIVLVVSPYILAVEAGTAIGLGYLLWTHTGMWVFTTLVWVLPTASLVVSIAIAATTKWLLLGRIEEGRWPVYSRFYRNKWFVDHLVQDHVLLWQRIARLFGSPIATMIGCRITTANLFGANIRWGPRLDPSMYLCYDLLEVETGALFGGGTSIKVFEEHDGFLYGRRVRVGKAAFTGALAVLLPGATLEDGAAVAAYSSTNVTIPSGRVCIGSNVLRTTVTSKHDSGSNTNRLKDAVLSGLVACLLAITGAALFTWLIVVSVEHLTTPFASGVFSDAAMLVVTYGIAGRIVVPMYAFFMTLVSRYILAPSIKEGSHTYGSSWQLRGIMAWTILKNDAYHSWIMEAVGGTWMEVAVHRLLGAKIGKNAYIDCMRLFEPVMACIGDGVTINKFGCLSPHSYKVDSVDFGKCVIGDRCIIGTNVTFSGTSRMHDGAELDSFSMPLRGTIVTPGRWVGYPAMLEAGKRRNRAKKAGKMNV